MFTFTTKYQSNNTVSETNFAEILRTHNVSQICLSLESSLQVASRPFRKTVKHVWETTSLRSKLSESTLKRHKDNSKSLRALHWLTRQVIISENPRYQRTISGFWCLSKFWLLQQTQHFTLFGTIFSLRAYNQFRPQFSKVYCAFENSFLREI